MAPDCEAGDPAEESLCPVLLDDDGKEPFEEGGGMLFDALEDDELGELEELDELDGEELGELEDEGNPGGELD